MFPISVRRTFQIILPLATYMLLYPLCVAFLMYVSAGGWPYILYLLIAALVCLIPIMTMYLQLPIVRCSKWFSKEDALRDILWIAGIVAVCLLTNLLLTQLGVVEASEGYQRTAENFRTGTLIMQIACTVVAVPILEETLYRGIILGLLRGWMNQYVALVMTAVIFGIMHNNMAQAIYAIIAGLMLGAAFLKTNKLWVSVFAHAIINLIVLLFI